MNNPSSVEVQEPVQTPGRWFPAATAFMMAIACSVAILAFYHHRYASTGSFATVDIAAIVKARETQFSALLSKPDVRDQDRQAAFRLVQKLGPEIERGVGILQQECRCTILVKSAVIAGPATDLTARLREIMDNTGGGQ